MSPHHRPNAFRSAFRWAGLSLAGRGGEFYRFDPEGYECVARVLLGRDEVAQSVRRVVDGIPGDKSLVLDAACGTGLVTHALAGSAGRVIGEDLCVEAVEFARTSKHPSLQFRVADLHDFSEVEDDSVDAYSMAFAHRFVRDRDVFYRQLRRVLAGNGVAIISTVGSSKSLGAIERHSRDAKLVMSVVQPRFRSLFNRMHKTAHVILAKPC